MALADTTNAIGAVSELLKSRIDTLTGIVTTVGRPSDGASDTPHLNLFLYEISFDPYLKNTALNEGEKPPLWVVLKYLLTAYETKTDSDSEKAHARLGAAIRAVYTDDLLKLDSLTPASVLKALSSNPSPLHVTFDEATSDLLAKLMQGPDEKVRLSICFQVRPVMIASPEPADLSLVVGIDHTKKTVPATLADPYVGIDIIPSMGAHIEKIAPAGFEVGEDVTIYGTDLHLANLSVMLGKVELPVVMQRPDELRFRVDPAAISASDISAGSHTIAVVQTLSGSGKKRRSNAVIGNLVPTLNKVQTVGAVTITGTKASAIVELEGLLLGADEDDCVLAFYRDGKVTNMFDTLTTPAGPPPRQTKRRLVMPSPPSPPDPNKKAVERGDYSLILLVNGQQAPQSLPVHLNNP